MFVTLERRRISEAGIFGRLLISDPQLGVTNIFYTLEHSYDGLPKIPLGVYRCVLGQHHLERWPVYTYEVTGVPGHSGLLIHYGNYNQDSHGCILLGSNEMDNMITGSRVAFTKFMAAMHGAQEFNLEISFQPNGGNVI